MGSSLHSRKISTQRTQRTTENRREISLPISATDLFFLRALSASSQALLGVLFVQFRIARRLSPRVASISKASGTVSTLKAIRLFQIFADRKGVSEKRTELRIPLMARV